MKKTLFNDNWIFTSDIDSTPRTVQLPHDAMQTEKRVPGLKNGSSTGYFPGGKYCYVKELTLSEADLQKTTYLEFEGIYMKSSVLLNGTPVGGHIYGYTDFFVDLTGKLKAGANEIKVIADNSQFPNSRWYSGSGIYRDVWLHMADQEFIRPDGIRVTTVSLNPAKILVQVDAVKEADTQVRITVCKGGKTVAAGEGEELTLEIPGAKFWSAKTPELYEIQAELIKDGKTIDSGRDSFGIRKLDWDAVKGFQVNGKTVKLRGGCVHHDHSYIGAAEFDVACERKMQIMKKAGFNAVRISHHPASRAMLRACDRVGMYVMNESFDTWLGLKTSYDYCMYFEQEWRDDLAQMIRVSYNHPSVVMYSIGNEVYLKDAKKAGKISKELADFCHEKDPSRAVINALNPLTVIMGDDKNPEQHRDEIADPREPGKGGGLVGSQLANVLITLLPKLTKLFGNEKAMKKRNACMEPLDIVGFNYGDFLYDVQHKDFPERVLCGSETFPAQIGKNWPVVKKRPWVVGDFLWTAWDYLGEAGVGTVSYEKQESFIQPFPCIAAGCANIDLNGEITPQGYYTAVVYGEYKKPYIAVHPVTHAGEKAFWGRWRFTDAVHSWSWPGCEGKRATVDVYAKAAQIEMFQDGHSLGKKSPETFVVSFEVEYRPGELKAVSYDSNGKKIGCDVLVSAGTETRLTIRPEKETLAAGGYDLMYLPIEITDENSVRHVLSDREITVKIDGAAELMALGSAELTQDSLQPYIGGHIRSFQGKALAILRSGKEAGEVHVTVSAAGLEAAELVIPVVNE